MTAKETPVKHQVPTPDSTRPPKRKDVRPPRTYRNPNTGNIVTNIQ